MKKTLATLLALIMALLCVPITAHASADSVINNFFYSGIQKPQKPYIHHFYNGGWDEIVLYQDANWDITFFGDTVKNGGDAYFTSNGINYITPTIQVDYKIDDGAWHYATDWDGDWIDTIPNSGLHQARYGADVAELSNKMLSFKLADAIAYNFDTPSENGDFEGLVSRSGSYPDYSNWRFDLTNHTYTYRYRYWIEVSDLNGSAKKISPWSDEVSIGKNATQQNLTKNDSPDAITILGGSCLNAGNDKNPRNSFYLDLSIPQSIYNDQKYYEIVEGAFEPLLFEVQYRVNGGSWKDGGVANATSLETTKLFNDTDNPLAKGDKVEFRIRIAEGNGNKNTKGPWSNTYAMTSVVTDYNYTASGNTGGTNATATQAEPAISNLNGTPSVNQVTNYITKLNNDNDPAGTSFAKIQVKQAKVTKNSVKISWNKVSGAKYYIIYGNKCGKNNKYKYIKKVTAVNFNQTKLKKGTYYKYIVCAFNANNKCIAKSKTTHVVTKGGKYCNFKSVSTKAKKDKVSLAKKGKTFKLGAKSVKENAKMKVSNHRKICYESSNTKVATVDKNGKITAKKKGTCYVYAYAQNGVFKKVKVTVKK